MKRAVAGSTVGVAFIAVGIVFGMLLVGRIRTNDECRASLAEVYSTRSAIEKFIDSKAKDVKLTDEELKIWTDFEEAYNKASNSYNKARNYDLMKSERDKIDEEWRRVEKLYKAEQVIKLATDGELSDEDIAKMKESEIGTISAYATDLSDYRAKVAEFYTQYKDVDISKNDEMNMAKGALVKLGEELMQHYAKTNLVDVLEMSRDDILAFYDTIDLLKNKD